MASRLRRKGVTEPRYRKRKSCPFTLSGIKPEEIDYKDVDTLRRFITDRGKILPKRITGVTTAHQHRLALAIKQARMVALLPFMNID